MSVSRSAALLSCWVLSACDAHEAPGSEASAERHRQPLVMISAPQQVLVGDELRMTLDVRDNLRLLSAEVLSSDRLGQGPCEPRSGLCLDLAAPTRQASFLMRNGERVLTWTPPAPGPLHVQAVLWSQAGGIAVSEAVTVEVVPRIPGCTRAESPDFDPAATVDDGSCACPDNVHASSMAELAPYLTCESLGIVVLSGFADEHLALPALREVDDLDMRTLALDIDLPALERYGSLILRDNTRLQRFGMTALQQGGSLLVRANPALTTLDLASTGDAGSIELIANRALRSLDLSQLATISGLSMSKHDALTDLVLADIQPTAMISIRESPRLRDINLQAISGMPEARLELVDLPALSALPALPAPVMDLDLRRIAGFSSLELLGGEVERLSVAEMPQLRSLRLAQAGRLPSLSLESNPLLGTVDLTGVSEVAMMYVRNNPQLVAFELPATLGYCEELKFFDNSALCVSGEPALASPPVGCGVTGVGNACDP